MRMAFATCVQLGLSCIEEIYRIGGKLDLLITLKDSQARNKSGRVYLDGIAQKQNVPLLKIRNINDKETIHALKKHQIDWLFLIGWSQIAESEVLHAPTCGCIGMHPTLLPIGRGRAAIPWAILKGLDRTGVTMFKLDEGVDTGPIIGQGVIPLSNNVTATELYQKVNDMHVTLISRYWNDIVHNKIVLQPQDESKATVWEGRKPEDGEISSNMTMEEAARMVRAVTRPYPGAFYKEGAQTIRIWSSVIDTNASKSGQLSISLRDGYLVPVDYEVE